MEQSKVLHILRNPFGIDALELKEAQLTAANMIEEYEKATAVIGPGRIGCCYKAENCIPPYTNCRSYKMPICPKERV